MNHDLAEVKKIFLEALSQPTPGERRACIDVACGDNAELRACVLAMLEAHEAFATPVPQGPTQSEDFGDPRPIDLVPGTVIAGKYKIIELISDGGMGSVYRAARIGDVRFEVALKVIKPGLDSRQVLARFNIERQALAMMNHENIARIFDAGMTEFGRPFFVMELVKGLSLTKYCDQNKLPVNERLELFAQVCSAVQHAHQKGIIHRDLKPSNIMVGLYDNNAIPKVIDFGLAKAMHQPITDDSLHTRINTFVGTLRYVAPEQAQLNNLDIDTRADVYSLGVILYELLTGKTPLDNEQLDKAAQDEVRRLIREEEPPKPSEKIRSSAELPSIAALRRAEPLSLQKLVRGDLDWVVMKALEKNRDRRYGSASDLAAEVERFKNGEPVEAGPPTYRYRLSKLLRRHRRKALAASFLVAAVVIGAIVSTIGWIKADQERRRADGQTKIANRQAAIAKSVGDFLTDDLINEVDPAVQAQPGREFISNITVKRALDRASDKVGRRFAEYPLNEAAIRYMIGRTYVGLGDYKAARMHLERAESLRRRESGSNDPDRLNALHELGWVLLLDGQFGRSRSVLEEAVRLRVEEHGIASAEACKSRYALALLTREQDRLDEAKAMFEDVLIKQKEVLTLRNRDTLMTQRELAGTLQDKKDFARAERLLLEVLEVQKDLLGASNPETYTTRNNLAVLYDDDDNKNRQTARAVEIMADLVKISEPVLTPEHPRYLTYCLNYAGLLLSVQRYDDAIRICEKIEPILVHVRAPTALETLGTLQIHAVALFHLGRLTEAEPLLLKVHAGCCQSEELGELSERTKIVIDNIIELYRKMNKPDKVKEWTDARDKSNKKALKDRS